MAQEDPNQKLKIAYEDIERMTVKDGELKEELIKGDLQKQIVAQIDSEYNVCWSHTEAKRAVWLARLKLYNNQRRDADAVGDPLMFTIFNTVLAALYDDRLTAKWEGRGGEGDEEVEENLNALSAYDYDLMQKDELDYEWDWDAAFFGRGLVLQMGFDRREGRMCPISEVIDPATFIRDPRAASVNGDMMGKGSMRFGGFEGGATYWELKNSAGYFNVDKLKKDKETRSLLREMRAARADAQGTENYPQKEESLGKYDNYEFSLLNWFTTIKGEKYLVTLANERSVIIKLQKLKYGDRWPIQDRTIFPISHDWDSVSIPDLTEDKQRMRAVLLNLGVKGAKADEMPRYLFDKTRIKNKNDLNFRVNKYIGVDGRVDNAILPVPRTGASQAGAVIMDILDRATQRATATPEVQQGVSTDQQRTLGELQLVAAKVDTRYSMSAKIFGWSEKRFWNQWYMQYKTHFKDEIDEKVLRVEGPMAPVWRTLTRENIITQIDPDVRIESRIISEAKQVRQQQSYDALAGILLQDPEVNRRYFQKKLAKLRGMRKEEVDLLFPPTVDEMQAEDENVILNGGSLPKISVNDDHQEHLRVHLKANQNPHTLAHVRAHKKLMILKRNRPDLFPPEQVPGLAIPGANQVAAQGAGAAPAPTPTQ